MLIAGGAAAAGVGRGCVVAVAMLGAGAFQRAGAGRHASPSTRPQAGVFHDFVPLKGKARPRTRSISTRWTAARWPRCWRSSGDQVAAGQPLVKFRNTALELDVLDREGRLVESITQLQTYEKQLEQTRVANAKAAQEIDYNIVRLEPRRRSAASPAGPAASSRASRPTRCTTSWPTTSALQPMQADSNRRQEALRQAPAAADRRRDGDAAREPGRHPQQARQPDRAEGAGRRQAHRGRPAGRPDPQAAATGSGEVVPATGFKAQADIDEYYLGRVAVGQAADVDLDGKSYPMVVTRVDPAGEGRRPSRSSWPSRAPQPPDLLPGEALEGKLAVGGDRAGADPARRRRSWSAPAATG